MHRSPYSWLSSKPEGSCKKGQVSETIKTSVTALKEYMHVSSSFHFLMMDLTVLQGIFNDSMTKVSKEEHWLNRNLNERINMKGQVKYLLVT